MKQAKDISKYQEREEHHKQKKTVIEQFAVEVVCWNFNMTIKLSQTNRSV